MRDFPAVFFYRIVIRPEYIGKEQIPLFKANA